MQAARVAAGTAVIYRRVSSESQSGERHVSLEVQAARTANYIRARGYILAQTFTDVASGRRDDRQQYQAMLAFVRQGGASLIVTQFLDRFGRNPREILRRVWQLEEAGVKVECADEDVSQELVLLIRAGVAGAESKRIGERVRHTLRRAVERGMKPGVAPYGYRAVKRIDEAGKVVTVFEQDPAEAAIVREMYEMRAVRNMGLKTMADMLNAKGYRSKRGKMWAPESIKVVLQNPALVGRFAYGRWQGQKAANERLPLVTVANTFPAILTSEEWDALQLRMRIRREESMKHGRVNISHYLLSGMLRCGECGAAMAGSTSRTYQYYVCGNKVKSKSRCPNSIRHKAAPLETAVLEKLGEYSDPATVRKLLASDKGRDVERQERELKQIDARLDKLTKDLKMQMGLLSREIIDEEQFARLSAAERTERQTLMERRAIVEAQVKAAKERQDTAQALPGRVGAFLTDFGSLDILQRKAILQELLGSVRVWTDNRVELTFRQ